jgi:queuine tRNA-ribosyltransferase
VGEQAAAEAPAGSGRLRFRVERRDGLARLARLGTPHGEVETPAFMPVGTLGAVKGMVHDRLLASGAQLLMTNLFHLLERVGAERIAGLGGLHDFIGWDGPLAMDSGGYQVFSLAGLRRVSDRGVTFQSPHDGSRVELTPERVVEVQDLMGVDLAMVLDECPPWPVEHEAAADALRRTTRWARRSLDRRGAAGQGAAGLFGIVQGSFFEDLRLRSVADLAALPFDGYAIGGVSVGEDRELGRQAVSWVAPALPEDRPRYLMGLGTPEDMLHAVRLGVDLFDCVLPSRNARHGTLFTSTGMLRIKTARYRDDRRPVDAACACSLCSRHSRAFLHHLFRCGEITGKVLATEHNVHFFLNFMAGLRRAIAAGGLADLDGAGGREGAAVEAERR